MAALMVNNAATFTVGPSVTLAPSGDVAGGRASYLTGAVLAAADGGRTAV